MSLSTPHPKAVGCHSCDRMSRDDGSWNKWTDPDGVEYHICHVCFTSLKHQWREEFQLYQKAGFGTIYMPRGLPTATRMDIEHELGSLQRFLDDLSPTEGSPQSYRKTSQPFRYSRLRENEIRILSILPGNEKDDICCNLKAIDLDAAEAVKYEALSYHWGRSQEDPQTIWINGCTFSVSYQLFTAINSLRDPKLLRSLWIDAISINQTDDKEEKMAQIRLMGKIYRLAHQVVIWLGPADDNSDKLMDAIASSDIEVLQSSEFFYDFQKLLLRAWFYRTWIIQEFVLAKFPPNIVCGSKCITSGKFLAVDAFLTILGKHSARVGVRRSREHSTATSNTSSKMHSMPVQESPMSRLVDLRSAALDDEGNLRPRSLAGTLRYFRDSHVTDLRDKIYGALGLVDELVHDFIRADSRKSMAEAYTDAMAYMFNVELEKYDIEILHLFLTYPCSLSLTNPVADLPSWVPDFSQKRSLLGYEIQFNWFWLYQITRSDGRNPSLKLQHGRHRIQIDRVDRSLLRVEDKNLILNGLLVDEIIAGQPSAFYADFPKDFNSAIEKLFGQSEGGRMLKDLLQSLLESSQDDGIGAASNIDLQFVFSRAVQQMGQAMFLLEVEEICRQHMSYLERNVSDEEWMSFIWRDLFEGFREEVQLSEEQFRRAFHGLVGSTNPTVRPDWLGGDGELRSLQKNGGADTIELEATFLTLLGAPNCFFMTKDSGFYGIAPPGIRKGDKLVFLFPPLYVAFILRPSEGSYRMLGVCLIPPRVRDRYMNDGAGLRRASKQLDEFIIK